MHHDSLLRATDQVRKLHLAAAAGIAAVAVLAIAQSFNSSSSPVTFAILLICGAALLVVAFLSWIQPVDATDWLNRSAGVS